MFKNNFFLSIYKYEWGIERLITHYIMLRGFAKPIAKGQKFIKSKYYNYYWYFKNMLGNAQNMQKALVDCALMYS